MKKRIKIQGFLIFLATLATISLSKFVFPHWKKEPWDEFLDVVGIGLVLFGFLFRITARGYKQEKSYNGKLLVKDGPYAMVRNPMYFGTFMIGTGGYIYPPSTMGTFLICNHFLVDLYPTDQKGRRCAFEAIWRRI